MDIKRQNYIIELADIARAKVKQLFPIDPILIAKSYGVEVLTARLPRDISGQIYYKEKKIFIESTDYITRQVFSIAHELGHFLLHNDGTLHVSKRDSIASYGIDLKEIEANFFSANLLMPHNEIIKLISNNFNIDSLACYFGVSVLAMQNRLNNLGINVYV